MPTIGEVPTKPKSSEEIRQAIRTLCHIALPAAGDLRKLAKYVQPSCAAALRSFGMSERQAEDLAGGLARDLINLAVAQETVAERGQIVLDQIAAIHQASRNRREAAATFTI